MPQVVFRSDEAALLKDLLQECEDERAKRLLKAFEPKTEADLSKVWRRDVAQYPCLYNNMTHQDPVTGLYSHPKKGDLINHRRWIYGTSGLGFVEYYEKSYTPTHLSSGTTLTGTSADIKKVFQAKYFVEEAVRLFEEKGLDWNRSPKEIIEIGKEGTSFFWDYDGSNNLRLPYVLINLANKAENLEKE